MKIYEGKRNDEWGTPADLIAKLGVKNAFDVCASHENHKFENYWTINDNCLNKDWPKDQLCWMNPPFSQARTFFQKAANEAAQGCKIVAIYKASNLEASVWQETIFPHASAVLFLKGRTNYVTGNKTSNGVPFGSAIIYYNLLPMKCAIEGKLFRLKI